MTKKQEEFFSLCDRLKEHLGEKAELYKRIWLLKDSKGKMRIEKVLTTLAVKKYGTNYATQIYLDELPPEITDEKKALTLGELQDNKLFTANPEELLKKHLMITGQSGAGKSTAVWRLLEQLMTKKDTPPIFLFDWKEDYTPLCKSEFNNDMLVFRPGETGDLAFNFNPLLECIKLGMSDDNTEEISFDIVDNLISLLCYRWLGGEGVRRFLMRGAREITQTWIDSGYTDEKTPDLKKLLTWLQALDLKRPGQRGSQRSTEWRESAERALDTLAMTEYGNQICTSMKEHINYSTLAETSTLFLMEKISQDNFKQFFVESIFLIHMAYRMKKQKEERGAFTNIFIIDEAHNVLEKGAFNSEPVLLKGLRMSRSLGCGIVLIDQLNESIPLTAKANTASKISFTSDEISTNTARTLGLNTKEKADYLTRLEVGQAICRFKEIHDKPFLMKFPCMDEYMMKTVNNEELKQFAKRSFEKIRQTNSFTQIPKNSHAHKGQQAKENPPLDSGNKHTSMDLSLLERIHLRIACENPYQGITNIWQKMNVSRRKGAEIRDNLVNKGLITIQRLFDNGSPLKLIKLTKNGETIANEMGIKTTRLQRQGSIEHEYHRNKRQKFWETLEFKTEYEKDQADIAITTKEGKKYIDEIYTGKTPIQWDKTFKLLKKGYDKIYFTPTSKAARAILINELKTMELYPHSDKIEISTL